MADGDDYEVGFGRPPKPTRFKKGQSGNPSGKSKKPKDTHAILDKLLSDSVMVVQDGRKVKTTTKEVIRKQLVHGAMKGSLSHTKLLISLIASQPQEAEAPLIALTPEWIALLEDVMSTGGGSAT